MSIKSQTYRIYDACLWIEVGSGALTPRALYYRLQNLLISRGFQFQFDTFNGAKGPQPRSWHWRTCNGQCGDLHCHAEVTHQMVDKTKGKVNFEFWQNIVLEKGRDSGRFAQSKRAQMPFLIRMKWQATIRAMTRFLEELGFTKEESGWYPDNKRRGLEWIRHRMKGSVHTPKDYDPLTHTSTGHNVRNLEGEQIIPGRRYCAYQYGRLVIGTAYYNLNNMWWLVPNDRSLPMNMGSHELFKPRPGLPRRKPLDARRRLEVIQRKYKHAQEQQLWLRCHALQTYLSKVAA